MCTARHAGGPSLAATLLTSAALLVGGARCSVVPDAAPPGQEEDGAAFAERAAVIASFMRAAIACGQPPVSATAQDRAATIETAVLDLQQRTGGTAARDAFLHAVAPPAFDPRQRGRDRAAWCAERQPDVARVAAWLDGPDGAAFARRADPALR
jgi:hypothetical protein